MSGRDSAIDLESVESRFARLITIGIALSAERNHDRLLETILLEAKRLTRADGGTLYLRAGRSSSRDGDPRSGENRRRDAERRGLEPRRASADRREPLPGPMQQEQRQESSSRRKLQDRRFRTDRRGGEDRRAGEDRLEFVILRNDTLNIALGGSTGAEISFLPILLHDPVSGEPNHNNVASHVALSGLSVNIADAYHARNFDFSGTRKFDEKTGYRSQSFLTVPLKNYNNKVIGVLQLINAKDAGGKIIPFGPDIEPVVMALASQAAVALDNQQLIQAQKNLFESFIEIIAAATDAKSPYTGGHCQRVPELAEMLARAACESQDGIFKDFNLSDDELYELHLAAWLHDCGKVTTPEYVVDKATKLETIYNRIHEIRMRFEVLKRDAEIAYLKALNEGKKPESELRAAFEKTISVLDEEFSFVADCNIGGEFLDDEKIKRLNKIASRTWMRTLDDRKGLSFDDLARAEKVQARPIPVEEHLLCDREDHIIPWGAGDMPARKEEGFDMDVPSNRMNLGELYNLSIRRGTLTAEERYKINEHIVQTIRILDCLPFPEGMARIPEYAGSHHETMGGTGYPRRLSRDDMSLPARIMAIADIFEALTACDRPYKKAKTLSEAIKIMSFMKKDQHIDPDLFSLFLKSGVYRRYAEQFLKPFQIDDVNIADYIAS